MALEGQQGVVAVHTFGVVGDSNQFSSTAFHLDADTHGSRVQRVFKKFLDHGRGPIHHFARSDLVGYLIGKNSDLAHKNSE